MKTRYLTIITAFILVSFTIKAQWTKCPGPFVPDGVKFALLGSGKVWLGTTSGIYSSTNNALTWQKVPILDNLDCMSGYIRNDSIYFVAISSVKGDLADPDTLFFAQSTDGGASWSQQRLSFTTYNPLSLTKVQNTLILYGSPQCFYSFNDGASWGTLDSVSDNFVFNDRDILWTKNEGYPFTGVYSYWVSSDGLHTFHYLDSARYDQVLLSGTAMLAVKSFNDSVPYFEIYHSLNSGVSWDTSFRGSQGILLQTIADFQGVLWFDSFSTGGSYYVSTDHGSTWQLRAYDTTAMEMELQLNYPRTLLPNGTYLNVQSGRVLIEDKFAHVWQTATTGLNNAYFHSIFAHRFILYAGYYDDVMRSADGGQTWTNVLHNFGHLSDLIYQGDTVFVASDLFVAWSYDNGLHWQSRSGETGQDIGTLTRINNRIFFSGAFQFTDNFGVTWDSLPKLPLLDMMFNTYGSLKAISNNLFCVEETGIVFKYNTISQQWDSIFSFWSTGAHVNNLFYTLGDVIVLAGRDVVLRSTDFGNTWQNIRPATTQASVRLRSLVAFNDKWIGILDTIDQSSISNHSLYSSLDSGRTWQRFESNDVPFYIANQEKCLALINNILYSTSRYTGLWRRSGSFSTINGTVFQDDNHNGIRDVGERPLKGFVVATATGQMAASTNSSGDYHLSTDEQGATFQVSLPAYAQSTPTSRVTTGAAMNAQDFGLYVNPAIHDLSIDIASLNPFRWLDDSNQLFLTVRNKAGFRQPSHLTLVFDSNIVFRNASPSPLTRHGDTLFWNTDTLDFLDQFQVQLEIGFTGSIGQHVICHAWADPVAGDSIPADNRVELHQPITGPFDPNFKQCENGDFITPQQVAANTEMVYTIHFQNEGNAPAVNIHVSDTLSSLYEPTTLRVINSSHPVDFILRNHLVDFYFTNINLPPAMQSEPLSNGFVQYGIQCKNTLQLGDVLSNTGHIYFDHNPVVNTNEALTVVGTHGLVMNVLTSADVTVLKVFPVPANEVLNVDVRDFKDPQVQIEIFDASGCSVSTIETGDIAVINTESFAEGVYAGRALHAGQMVNFRFVVRH